MAARKSIPSLPAEQLFFHIGEVARLVGVKPYVLRYWETEFRQLAPEKGRTGQRTYSRQEVRLAQLIAALVHGQRYTIAGARKVLTELKGDWEGGLAAVGAAPPPTVPIPDEGGPAHQVAELDGALAELERVLARREAELKALKAAQGQLTGELVSARGRIAELERQMAHSVTCSQQLERELAARPTAAGVAATMAALRPELEALLALTTEEVPSGPSVQVD